MYKELGEKQTDSVWLEGRLPEKSGGRRGRLDGGEGIRGFMSKRNVWTLSTVQWGGCGRGSRGGGRRMVALSLEKEPKGYSGSRNGNVCKTEMAVKRQVTSRI